MLLKSTLLKSNMDGGRFQKLADNYGQPMQTASEEDGGTKTHMGPRGRLDCVSHPRHRRLSVNLVGIPQSKVSNAVLRFAALSILVLGLLLSPSLQAGAILTYTVGTNPVALAFDGTNIWVSNASGNTVMKLSASSGTIVDTYPVMNPMGLVFDGINIWVASGTKNTVTKLVASTGAVVGTYPAGYSPTGLAYDGSNIWVSNYVCPACGATNTVTKLLASTGVVIGTYPVGSLPIGVAFDGANIWVANEGSNNVTKLLASTGALVGTYPVGSSPGALAFDGTDMWVANEGSNNVTKLLASTGAIVGTYSVGGNPLGVAFDGINIWVANAGSNSVTKLLASTGGLLGNYPVGTHPDSVVFDGTNIWVANFYDNTVTEISPASQAAPNIPQISPGGVVPLYSTVATIQSGEWTSIYGTNLARSTTTWNGEFPISLGGTSVTINGKAAFLSFVSPGQINLQAPDDTITGTVPVVVTTANGTATSSVTLAPFGPSFLLLDARHVAGIIPRSDGSGAWGGGTYDILGPTGTSLRYATVAAKPGDIVELFATGLGPTDPTVQAGQAFSGVAPTTNQVSLLINNATVLPDFAGLSGAGLDQINVTIPDGIGTGDVRLIATVNGERTQAGVVIALYVPPPTGITGFWNFTATSAYGFQTYATGQLTQNGNNISGELSLTGTPCATSAAVSGTVSGNALSVILNENGQLVTFTGTVSLSVEGDSATGTYAAPAGGCTDGDHGIWAGFSIP